MDYTIKIKPMPCPRPRARKAGKFISIYMPSTYTTYQEVLQSELKKLNIPARNYWELEVCFHIPYPKGTPKKDLIEGALYIQKPDADNYLKTMQDGLEGAGIVPNDCAFADCIVRKRRTIDINGRIEFSLHAL